MKSILILGVGDSQRDLAIAAKNYGAKVYACAKSDSGPALDYVDEFRRIDILDKEAVEAFAREKEVDAIYTIALEIALRTIVEVSERLGLRTFVSSEDMWKLENKAAWRKALGEIPGNLKFLSASTIDETKEWDHYPAVMKPVDGSGQRGVVKINNEQELKAQFERSQGFSRSKTVIIEEFAGGEEVSVNSFMCEGELAFAVLSDRISHKDLPGGLIQKHKVPSKFESSEIISQINALVINVNNTMNFKNGHVYFQLKIHDARVSLIEFTPRYDACHMWRLIREAYKLDLLQVSLEWLFEGKSETLMNYQRNELEFGHTLEFVSDKPGHIVKYGDFDINQPAENILYNYWYYNEGDKVRSVTGILEKVGYYIYQEN